MTTTLDAAPSRTAPRRGASARSVRARRLVAFAVVVLPLAWACLRTLDGRVDLVNTGGLALVDDLLATAFDPALDAEFLAVVWRALCVTVAFALLGTAGALVLGALLCVAVAAEGENHPAKPTAVATIMKSSAIMW